MVKRIPTKQELVSLVFHGGIPSSRLPLTNDDDIATRIHREVMERNPGNATIVSPKAWKQIREAVRRWRVKSPPEDRLQQTLFSDLDRAKEKGVIR